MSADDVVYALMVAVFAVGGLGLALWLAYGVLVYRDWRRNRWRA